MGILGLYLIIFAVFFAVGVPIVLSLSVSAVLLLFISNVDLLVFTQQFFQRGIAGHLFRRSPLIVSVAASVHNGASALQLQHTGSGAILFPCADR